MNKNKKRGWFRSGEEEGGAHRDGSAQPAELSALAPPGPALPLREHAEEASIDMHVILESAGISRDDRDRVDRARALLQALPSGVSAAVRRQIVETALSSFGVATDLIVDAGQKVGVALSQFITSNQEATEKLLEDAGARVQALEQEIYRVRQAAEQAVGFHEKRIRDANSHMVAVNQVLEFFGGNPADADLDEPTEDRSGWGVELPIPPPARVKRDTAGKPPPVPSVEASGKLPDPSKLPNN